MRLDAPPDATVLRVRRSTSRLAHFFYRCQYRRRRAVGPLRRPGCAFSHAGRSASAAYQRVVATGEIVVIPRRCTSQFSSDPGGRKKRAFPPLRGPWRGGPPRELRHHAPVKTPGEIALETTALVGARVAANPGGARWPNLQRVSVLVASGKWNRDCTTSDRRWAASRACTAAAGQRPSRTDGGTRSVEVVWAVRGIAWRTEMPQILQQETDGSHNRGVCDANSRSV